MIELQQFYADLYSRTGGYVFNWPLGKILKIGDFFTLRPGGIGVVGNIYEPYFQLDLQHQYLENLAYFESPVLEPLKKEAEEWQRFKPTKDLWVFKNNCESNYRSTKFIHKHKEKTESPDVNTYTTHLNAPGSYFFSASDTHYLRMPHFIEIRKEIIRRLTTQFYNFNSIYLITEVCIASEFSIGVSRSDSGELIVSTEEYHSGDFLSLMGNKIDFEVERVNSMGLIKLRHQGGVIGFKAKKMDLSLKAKETLINHIYNTADPSIRKYAVEMINHDLYHLFPGIEINPSNANEFFSWGDMSMEDVRNMVSYISF